MSLTYLTTVLESTLFRGLIEIKFKREATVMLHRLQRHHGELQARL